MKKKDRRTIPANKVAKRPVEWIWEKHIPYGMLSIIAGWPEKGKSMLTSRIAADVSQEAAVIISAYEDPMAEVGVPRLEAAGANMDNIFFWKRMLLPRDLYDLREEIYSLGALLVILDPASSHTRNSIYNATAIRDSFDPLIDIAEETDAAFIFVHHIVKKVDLKADPQSAIGGSGGGLGAMVRCAYLFGESPDDPDERMLVQLKCNIAGYRPGLKFEMDVEQMDDDVDAGYLELRGTHSYRPQQILTAQPHLKKDKLEAVAEFLVESLREGPMLTEKLLDGAVARGFTKRMTKRVADMLELVSKKNKWDLPEEFPDDWR